MNPPEKLTDMTIRPFLARTLPQGFYLNSEGITKRNPSNENLGINYINVLFIMKYIPKLFQKHSQKKFFNVNSYTGKNRMEDYLKTHLEIYEYISNGEFILAMLLLGYEYRRSSALGTIYPPNLTFNASFRDKNKIVCECGLEVVKHSMAQHIRSRIHNSLIYHAETNPHLNDTESEFGHYLDQAIDRMKNPPPTDLGEN